MSSNPIFLDNPEDTVILLGKTFTVKELQEEVIDSRILKDKLSELTGGQ